MDDIHGWLIGIEDTIHHRYSSRIYDFNQVLVRLVSHEGALVKSGRHGNEEMIPKKRTSSTARPIASEVPIAIDELNPVLRLLVRARV